MFLCCYTSIVKKWIFDGNTFAVTLCQNLRHLIGEDNQHISEDKKAEKGSNEENELNCSTQVTATAS